MRWPLLAALLLALQRQVAAFAVGAAGGAAAHAGRAVTMVHDGCGAVIMYTRPECAHCSTARAFLVQKGVPVEELCVATDEEALLMMLLRTGVPEPTLPQIFAGENHGHTVPSHTRAPFLGALLTPCAAGETHIGGCDEMLSAAEAGQLEEILARAGVAGFAP